MWLFDQSYAMLTRFHPFMMGATFALSLVAGLLFFSFYRRSRDRLFLLFLGAFALMAVNRVAIQASEDSTPALYLVRLLAFCLILYAIVDKNRSRTISRK